MSKREEFEEFEEFHYDAKQVVKNLLIKMILVTKINHSFGLIFLTTSVPQCNVTAVEFHRVKNWSFSEFMKLKSAKIRKIRLRLRCLRLSKACSAARHLSLSRV